MSKKKKEHYSSPETIQLLFGGSNKFFLQDAQAQSVCMVEVAVVTQTDHTQKPMGKPVNYVQRDGLVDGLEQLCHAH